jgi:hypothetical protein
MISWCLHLRKYLPFGFHSRRLTDKDMSRRHAPSDLFLSIIISGTIATTHNALNPELRDLGYLRAACDAGCDSRRNATTFSNRSKGIGVATAPQNAYSGQ